jgi:hypothetical protein
VAIALVCTLYFRRKLGSQRLDEPVPARNGLTDDVALT